jgi:hypothetical protein
MRVRGVVLVYFFSCVRSFHSMTHNIDTATNAVNTLLFLNVFRNLVINSISTIKVSVRNCSKADIRVYDGDTIHIFFDFVRIDVAPPEVSAGTTHHARNV